MNFKNTANNAMFSTYSNTSGTWEVYFSTQAFGVKPTLPSCKASFGRTMLDAYENCKKDLTAQEQEIKRRKEELEKMIVEERAAAIARGEISADGEPLKPATPATANCPGTGENCPGEGACDPDDCGRLARWLNMMDGAPKGNEENP